MARIIVLAIIAVFLPACASAQGNPLGGLLNPDVLCAGAGVGTGLGVSGKHGAGWGLLAGAGAGLICKGVTDAVRTQGQPSVVYGQPPVVYGSTPPVYYQPSQPMMVPTPSSVYQPSPVYQPAPAYQPQPPAVYHQPGAVMVPPAGYPPEGYETRQIVAQNNTRGVISVRTPQGMRDLAPGGAVQFHEYVSTSAGGAFYAVHAMATVQVPGGNRSQWAHAYTSNNGTLIYTAEFRDSSWGGKIVPSYAAERHELIPPPTVYGAPGVQAPPAPPQSYAPPAATPQAGADDEKVRLLAEIEALKLRLKELEKKPADPLIDSK